MCEVVGSIYLRASVVTDVITFVYAVSSDTEWTVDKGIRCGVPIGVKVYFPVTECDVGLTCGL